MHWLSSIFKTFKAIFVEEEQGILEEPWSDKNLLEEIHKEWQAAFKFFDEVSDPELVECAIFNLRAVEKKYGYILNRIKSDTETDAVEIKDSCLIRAVL